MRRGSWTIAFVALWALLVASCGGTGEVTRSAYGTQLRSTMADLESAYGDAGAAVATGGARTTAAAKDPVQQLRTSQIALRDAGNRLDEIHPPKDLAADHRELVRGVRDMADAIDLLILAQQAADTDPKRASQLARRFATDPSFAKVQAAATKIEKAGVDAGL